MDRMSRRSQRVTPDSLTAREARSIATCHLEQGKAVYRCHSRRLLDGRTQGSWFFASGFGRFDLPEPDGTLNVAREPIGAVKESFGHLLIGATRLRREEVEARKLVHLTLVHGVDVADLFDTTAAHAGIVTGELTNTGPDYAPFQSLAASFRVVGVDGLAAPLRFSINEHTVGYYLFGIAGPRAWPTGTEERLDALLTDRGYTIEDPPTSRAITLVDS